jgi:hypothetical protein
MTKAEQAVFVNSLLDSVKADILSKVEHFPENWDGFEIRQYITDTVNTSTNWCKMDNKRMKDYKNTVMVTGNL